ncbi:MAG TPA: hypothetical protein VM286_01410 [Candidatus Thermoplasmatota archaeon]|nr:hypothetical protein [Candidatus Thermoplasmatota archaeon]
MASTPLPGLRLASNEDLATCRACGGQCCKTLPGAYLPDQLTPQRLKEGLEQGNLVLAWWDGDPRPGKACFDVDCDGSCPRCTDPERLRRAYYVRPRNVASRPGVFDASTNGACTLLGAEGCTLTFGQRPAGCQNLLANKEEPGNCTEYAVPTKSFKHYAALAWVPHQGMLLRLANKTSPVC